LGELGGFWENCGSLGSLVSLVKFWRFAGGSGVSGVGVKVGETWGKLGQLGGSEVGIFLGVGGQFWWNLGKLGKLGLEG